MEFRAIRSGMAALIFCENGIELVCPGIDDPKFDEQPSVPDHICQAAAVGLLLSSEDPEFVELRERLDRLLEEKCNASDT